MAGELTPQAGEGTFVSSIDPRLGVMAAKVMFWAPDRQTGLLTPAPDIDLGIPEWNARSVTRRKGGEAEGYDVVISYEGHPNPAEADEESFELEGSTAEDPIESHWNIEVLLKNYKGKLDANQRAKWPLTLTDETGNKRKNKMHGVENWPQPGLIWNHNFVSANLPESLVRELGTISRSVPGNPPQLEGNRDWLCMRIRGKQRGNIWQLQRSWQLSNPGGSVPEMYQVSR